MDASTQKRLGELMERMYAAHQELLGALKRQQQAIRQFDVEQLEQLRDHCDTVAMRIMELEQSRQRLLGEGVTLRSVIDAIADPARSKVLALSAGLKDLAGKIATINRINHGALQAMLRHVQALYQSIAQTASRTAYGQDGRDAGGQTTSLMIDAVA